MEQALFVYLYDAGGLLGDDSAAFVRLSSRRRDEYLTWRLAWAAAVAVTDALALSLQIIDDASVLWYQDLPLSAEQSEEIQNDEEPWFFDTGTSLQLEGRVIRNENPVLADVNDDGVAWREERDGGILETHRLPWELLLATDTD